MQKPDGSASIEYCGRENISNKLLATLSEDDKVAIVLTEKDLSMLIYVFKTLYEPTTEQKAMLHDLLNFRRAAFGVPMTS